MMMVEAELKTTEKKQSGAGRRGLSPDWQAMSILATHSRMLIMGVSIGQNAQKILIIDHRTHGRARHLVALAIGCNSHHGAKIESVPGVRH